MVVYDKLSFIHMSTCDSPTTILSTAESAPTGSGGIAEAMVAAYLHPVAL